MTSLEEDLLNFKKGGLIKKISPTYTTDLYPSLLKQLKESYNGNIKEGLKNELLVSEGLSEEEPLKENLVVLDSLETDEEPEEPKKLTLKEGLDILQDFEKANDNGVSRFAEIRDRYEQRDPTGLMEAYNALLDDIFDMIQHYGRLGKDTFMPLHVFQNLETTCGSSLEKACLDMNCDKEPCFDLYKGLEEVNFSGDGDEDDVEYCETLHDLIRFLHEGVVQSIFSGENISDEPVKMNYVGGTFNVLRSDDGKNQDILDAITELYKHSVDKEGGEDYKVLLTENDLFVRINLGAHFSFFDVRMNDDNASINLKFVNTLEVDYDNAPYREKYVMRVLKKLGYKDFRVDRPEVRAKVREIDRNNLPGLLKETVRMFASTTDLDLADSYIKEHLTKAVNLFFGGTTNIYSRLQEIYS
jgi:hypothetical protein